MITVTRETISPAKSEKYLATRGRQLHLIEARVVRLADAIRRGEWEENGESIIFNVAGELVDGQHRLEACVRANRPIKSVVVRGVSEYAFDTLDGGRSRSLRHVLEIEKETAPADLARTISLLWRWYVTRPEDHIDAGRRSMRTIPAAQRPTDRQLAQFFRSGHQGLRDCLLWGARLHGQLGGARTIWAVAYYVISAVDEADAADFFEKLWRGTGLSEGDPILALRARMISERTSDHRLSDYELIAITAKSWNAFRAGENVYSARWRTGGARPEKFPVLR